MFRPLFDLKLKYQLFILTLMAIFLVVIVQTAYYIRMTSITEDKLKLLTDQSVSQMQETTGIVFDKAKNAAMYFAYSSSVQNFMATDDIIEKLNTKKHINDMLKTAIGINNEIKEVMLLDPHGKRIFSYNDQIRYTQELVDEVIKKENERGHIHLRTAANDEFLAYVMPIAYSAASSRHGEILGSIVVFLDPDILDRIINKSVNQQNVLFHIIDDKEDIVMFNDYMDANEETFIDRTSDIPSEKNITIRKEISSTGWSIVGVVNKREIMKDYDFFKGFAMFVGLIMILLLCAVGFAFNHSFVIPIGMMLKEMKKVGKEKLNVRIENLNNHNEIGDIVANINKMLDNHEALSRSIFETQQKMYDIELAKKQTELYALQSQVNPHFLFNTLQSIGGLAMLRDIPEVAEVVIAMGDIFRYSIKANDFVKIRDEVEIVKQYLKIIDIRFDGKLRWELNVQQEILEYKTIKMLLQPLVENAVYHGIEKLYTKGYLHIDGWMERNNIIFEITDNGPGIEDGKLKKIQKMLTDMYDLEKEGLRRQKIGLANIQWRIKLMLGEEYGLKIFNGHGEGVVVRIKLPVV